MHIYIYVLKCKFKCINRYMYTHLYTKNLLWFLSITSFKSIPADPKRENYTDATLYPIPQTLTAQPNALRSKVLGTAPQPQINAPWAQPTLEQV